MKNMRRFKMDLGEHIHGLNLLCGANLSDAELRITMREVNTKYPNEMYMQAKKALEKYCGSSSISNNPTHGRHPVALVTPKQESLFTSLEEYETYVAWKQSNRSNNQRGNSYNNRSSRDSSSPPKYPIKRNPIGRDDYYFKVTYVVPLSILLEIAQRNQKILKSTELKSIHLIKHMLQIYRMITFLNVMYQMSMLHMLLIT